VGSHWHFKGVEVVALSLDWFTTSAEEEHQPRSSAMQPTLAHIHVSMTDCLLRSVKCADSPENDMAHSWLHAMAPDGNWEIATAVRRCCTQGS
jgi:hypothetical protein